MPRVGPQSPTAAAAAWFVPPIITEIEQPGDAASRGREGVVIEPDLRERLVARVDVHMDLQREHRQRDVGTRASVHEPARQVDLGLI